MYQVQTFEARSLRDLDRAANDWLKDKKFKSVTVITSAAQVPGGMGSVDLMHKQTFLYEVDAGLPG